MSSLLESGEKSSVATDQLNIFGNVTIPESSPSP